MVGRFGAADILFLRSRLSLSSKHNTRGPLEPLSFSFGPQVSFILFSSLQYFSKPIRTDFLLPLAEPTPLPHAWTCDTTYTNTQIYHKDIMDVPSDEALQAYMEYFRRDTNTCRFLPFLENMIYFLVDDYDIKIDADALPTAAAEETVAEETVAEEKVRVQVVGRLLDEFKDSFDDPLGEPFGIEEEGIGEYTYVKAVDAFYFCLNRRQRQPSNLNRNTSVKTAKEQRDEDWKIHIENLHRQAKRGVQKSIFRAQKTAPIAGLGQSPSIERESRRESDGYNLAVNEANLRIDRPVRQTELDLERKSSTLDTPIKATPPRPLELAPVDRRGCFKHLLLKVSELHSERYGEVLERHPALDICSKLENNLTPGVRLVSDRGLFCLNG